MIEGIRTKPAGRLCEWENTYAPRQHGEQCEYNSKGLSHGNAAKKRN
jgi:hypothetical protein